MSRSTNQFLLCRAAARRLAIPIEHVIETMRALPVSALAGAPPFLRGITVIRGEPLPVVEATGFFDGESSRAVRFVTMNTAGRRVALAVDEIFGVQTIASDHLQQLPPLLHDAPSDVIAALGVLDEELLFVLQSARLLPESVWNMIDEGAVGK